MKTVIRNHFNPYFFIPFVLWCIAGAFLLWQFDTRTLFAFINQHYHPFSDVVMVWITRLGEGLTLVIIGLLLFYFKPFRNPWFFFSAIFCTLIPSLITQLLKYQIGASRPMVVYENQPWVHHLQSWALLHNNSFPSGHTTGAFSFFCMLACVLPARHRAWALFLFFFALATGYSRVYLAAHFFADVYVGSIIGTVVSFMICVLIYYIRYRKQQKADFLLQND